MALSATSLINPRGGTIHRMRVLAGALPQIGSALSLDATKGHVKPLVAGEAFAGICLGVETSAGSPGGDGYALVMRGTFLMDVTLTATGSDIGASTPVYCSDDGTFTLTATSNTLVGCVASRADSGAVTVAAFTAEASGVSKAIGSAAITAAVLAANAKVNIEAAPADNAVATATAVFWIDEANDKVKVKVKYADGLTIKSGDVAALT